jgi:hypothetical protein
MSKLDEHATTATPAEGGHRVPSEAVIALKRVWTREKMSGLELARVGRLNHNLGVVITVITAVTSLAIFASLQAETNTLARAVTGAVTALAAALAAWQTSAKADEDTETKILVELQSTMAPLRKELVQAISECQMSGKAIDRDLLDRAEQAVDKHEAAHLAEYPAFDKSELKAVGELEIMGLVDPSESLEGPSARARGLEGRHRFRL